MDVTANSKTKAFNTVLVANRGEIACRAIRTLKRLCITSVAVFSDADKNAEHVRMADIALPLAGENASDTYLKIDKIIAAAQKSGAEAVWPGYGFLSESWEFAKASEEAGIVFVGPTVEQIREFGLKHRARELATAAGMPTAPGTGLLSSVEEALEAADSLGYPVMLKCTAGGGGIGLERCENATVLRKAWDKVRRQGQQFFAEASVFLEKCVDHARHIEVQIFGDGKGKVIALGERDCSLQRRHQKVVEETPAPNLPDETRIAMQNFSVRLGEHVKYRSAGTVEYIYEAEKNTFYFLEVNARLQVEHPVTESVTGLDLVESMLLLAADRLDWAQLHVKPNGASIEVRLYAEDALKNFQPCPGVLTSVVFPEGLRIDSSVTSGSEVSAFYDPLIAKLIVHGDTRDEALSKLREALNATQFHGITTNLEYLRQILATNEVHTGNVWTGMLDSFSPTASVIEVLHPGTWSSVQDYPGRLGYWDIGVPPSGPMDDFAFRLANKIVGNHESAAALEFTIQGPTLQFHTLAVIALTGADCQSLLDGKPVPNWQPISVKAKQILTIDRAQSGCRGYLAVRNGIDVPSYLGSRSTFALGQFGGHAGRTLKMTDKLPISQPSLNSCTTPAPVSEPQFPHVSLIPTYDSFKIGVLYGPHGAPDFFTEDYIEEFFASDWQVHYNSNRLGVRLLGPKPRWTRQDGGEAGLHPSNIHDCEYAVGAINFTGDSPVILTCDGPSLGGFVCPVTVAKAELWKVGQVKPGDRVRFYPIGFDEAVALEKAQIRSIGTLTAVELPVSVPPSLSPKDGISSAVLLTLPATESIPTVVYRQAGDCYILIEYGDNVMDLALRLRVQLLLERLRELKHFGLKELSPGVRSLQVRYDGHQISQSNLIDLLRETEMKLGDISKAKVPSRIIHLPMAFEDSHTLDAVARYQETVRATAPWLPNNVDFIQRINGLSSREAVYDIIFNASYLVLGLGDVYLGAPCAVPIDPRHRLLSSKYSPARTFTSEGTVGIGGMYACIYGMDSPGGYQLVGRTLPIWNKFLKNPQFAKGEPWLLRFFDQVRFYSVSEPELLQLRDDFREGRAVISIEETQFDFAEYLTFLQTYADDIAAFREQQKKAFLTEVERWQQDDTAESIDVEIEQPSEEDGSVPVSADLDGNIWKILIGPGDYVEEGQQLIIVEAMKMELIIHSPHAGRVKRIVCHPGRPVSAGDVLLWLEN